LSNRRGKAAQTVRRGIACHFGTLKSPKGTVKELQELFDARVDIFERSTLQRLAADLVDSHGLRDPAEATTSVHSVVASAAYNPQTPQPQPPNPKGIFAAKKYCRHLGNKFLVDNIL